MSSKNTMCDHYFIGYADLNGKGEVIVEHYLAESQFDCMKQCLEAHGIYIHPTIDTENRLRMIAEHNNKLISIPRKVKMTII